MAPQNLVFLNDHEQSGDGMRFLMIALILFSQSGFTIKDDHQSLDHLINKTVVSEVPESIADAIMLDQQKHQKIMIKKRKINAYNKRFNKTEKKIINSALENILQIFEMKKGGKISKITAGAYLLDKLIKMNSNMDAEDEARKDGFAEIKNEAKKYIQIFKDQGILLPEPSDSEIYSAISKLNCPIKDVLKSYYVNHEKTVKFVKIGLNVNYVAGASGGCQMGILEDALGQKYSMVAPYCSFGFGFIFGLSLSLGGGERDNSSLWLEGGGGGFLLGGSGQGSNKGGTGSFDIGPYLGGGIRNEFAPSAFRISNLKKRNYKKLRIALGLQPDADA